MTQGNEYVAIMKRHEGTWKSYVVHAKDGSVTWEAHNGVTYHAKEGDELERQLAEEEERW